MNKIVISRKKTALGLCVFVPLCLTLLFAQSKTEGFRLKSMEGTNINWELESDLVNFQEDLKTLEGVKVTFYPKKRDPFTITADEGWVKENEKDEIFLENNVKVKGYLNSDIKCENLEWDSVSEAMHTSEKVEIEGEKWLITGEGMEFAPDGDIININKNVTMQTNQ